MGPFTLDSQDWQRHAMPMNLFENPAPDVSALPTLQGSVLKPHQEYVRDQVQNSQQNNAAIEQAMQGPTPAQQKLAELRQQLEQIQGQAPALPGPAAPPQIGWQQGLAALAAALFDRQHAGEYAAMPFQAANAAGEQQRQQALQDYELKSRQHQEQIANAVRVLGLQQDDVQQEMEARKLAAQQAAAEAKAAMEERHWQGDHELQQGKLDLEQRKADQEAKIAEAKARNEISEHQMNVLLKLPPEARKTYAWEHNIGSDHFKNAIGLLSPQELAQQAAREHTQAETRVIPDRLDIARRNAAIGEARLGLEGQQLDIGRFNADTSRMNAQTNSYKAFNPPKDVVKVAKDLDEAQREYDKADIDMRTARAAQSAATTDVDRLKADNEARKALADKQYWAKRLGALRKEASGGLQGSLPDALGPKGKKATLPKGKPSGLPPGVTVRKVG